MIIIREKGEEAGLIVAHYTHIFTLCEEADLIVARFAYMFTLCM